MEYEILELGEGESSDGVRISRDQGDANEQIAMHAHDNCQDEDCALHIPEEERG